MINSSGRCQLDFSASAACGADIAAPLAHFSVHSSGFPVQQPLESLPEIGLGAESWKGTSLPRFSSLFLASRSAYMCCCCCCSLLEAEASKEWAPAMLVCRGATVPKLPCALLIIVSHHFKIFVQFRPLLEAQFAQQRQINQSIHSVKACSKGCDTIE